MKYKTVTFWPFFLDILLTNQLIFSAVVCLYKILVFDEVTFPLSNRCYNSNDLFPTYVTARQALITNLSAFFPSKV